MFMTIVIKIRDDLETSGDVLAARKTARNLIGWKYDDRQALDEK
jgi:hypothetical protein